MWETDLVLMLRSIIGDLEGDTYTDAKLQQILVVSAYSVALTAKFKNNYVIDIQEVTISPDPVVVDDKDFVVLTVYKAACIILNSEVKVKGGNAIAMRDGPSSVDTSAGAQTLANLAKTVCQEYNDMLDQYKFNGPNSDSGPGQAILGPYSPGADFINWNRNTHRGNGWE